MARLRCEWAHTLDRSLPDDPDADFVAAVGAWMEDPTRTVWTSHDADGGAVGMVALTAYTRMPSPSDAAAGRWGYLGHLYVRGYARGEGLGEALVRHVLAVASDRGYAKVFLSPTVASIPLYRRCGFTDRNDLMLWQP
ncbi:GNAT family N-acetyltransferase [uncultured Williamsia sp.]|uniref:GNAT family N-acetyltransferase n=1 Tax=uncultured Williamsia sp. TaxID=259311 RepID=UPI0026072177|nr:GNAT family N-acetyltransferase [uncultured Williamsia sp.]